MKMIWLGQAGYLFTAENGMTIMIDPYMSDSLLESNGEDYERQVPIDEEILNRKLDVMIITHPHGDHMDFDTLDIIFRNNPNMYVLSSLTTQFKLRARYGGELHYMLFDTGAEINLNGIRFESTFAMHCDGSIGVIIHGDSKVICHTGDGMFCKQIKDAYPKFADALIVPINGKGNNMTAYDAVKLTRELMPKNVYPMHFDMFAKFGCDVKEFTDHFDGPLIEGHLTDKHIGIKVVVPLHYREVEL